MAAGARSLAGKGYSYRTDRNDLFGWMIYFPGADAGLHSTGHFLELCPVHFKTLKRPAMGEDLTFTTLLSDIQPTFSLSNLLMLLPSQRKGLCSVGHRRKTWKKWDENLGPL